MRAHGGSGSVDKELFQIVRPERADRQQQARGEPFIVPWSRQVPAGPVSDQVICLTNTLATFASLLNVPLPKGNAEDSFAVRRVFTEQELGAGTVVKMSR